MTQMARNEVVFYIAKCKKKVTEPQVYLIKQKIKQKRQKLYMCRKMSRGLQNGIHQTSISWG